MKRIRNWITVFAAIAAAFSLTACGGNASADKRSTLTDSSAGVSAQPSADSESQVSALDERKAQDLYNNYIEINNHMVGGINDALTQYFSTVNVESETFELVKAELNNYFCYYPHSARYLGYAQDAYEAASGKSEKDALDQAYLDLYPSLQKLITILGEIHAYTDDDGFLKDNYAKSQEQHTALMSVLEEYFTYGEVFMNELNAVASEREREELEELKAEGYEVLYTLNMAMLSAEDLSDELYRQGIGNENVLDMDLTLIQPLYDEFTSYVDQVLQYDQDKDKLKEEGLYVSVDGMRDWGFFVTALQNTHKSITEVLEKVQAGEPLDMIAVRMSGSGYASVSSFEEGVSETIERYNDLVAY
ncbi:MAG: YiiG family protein [Lachnoclostridium sp.]|nr:YiiG family protein [Lachnospira sp.]MCM1249343.1 YiiG family protein [Lachnoclostridium sp.]